MTINAFHPDYVKTYAPQFLASFRTVDANKRASMTLSKHVTDVRKAKPMHGFIAGISKADTAPREFHVYSKAKGKH